VELKTNVRKSKDIRKSSHCLHRFRRTDSKDFEFWKQFGKTVLWQSYFSSKTKCFPLVRTRFSSK